MKPYQLTHKDHPEGGGAAIVWLAVLLASPFLCVLAVAIAKAL